MTPHTITVTHLDESDLVHLTVAGALVTEPTQGNYSVTFPEGTQTKTIPMQAHWTHYPALLGGNDSDDEYDGTWQEDYYYINDYTFEHSHGTFAQDYVSDEPFSSLRTHTIYITPLDTNSEDDHPF